MDEITAEKIVALQEKIFSQPFDSLRLDPFCSDVEQKALLFPVVFKLELQDSEALVQSIKSVGDGGFYLRTESQFVNEATFRYWYISIDQLEAYYTITLNELNLDNVYMVSPSGEWGIRVDVEQICLIGGSRLFMETFFQHTIHSEEYYFSAFLD